MWFTVNKTTRQLEESDYLDRLFPLEKNTKSEKIDLIPSSKCNPQQKEHGSRVDESKYSPLRVVNR
jgi:hypothetical protein